MTADDFRDIVLGMQGVVEQSHMNHPDFRANGRIFATLDGEEKSGRLGLSPEEQQELMREYPETFSPVNGAWGRQGWTLVALAQADADAVRGAVILAWQGVMNKPPKRSPSKRRARR